MVALTKTQWGNIISATADNVEHFLYIKKDVGNVAVREFQEVENRQHMKAVVLAPPLSRCLCLIQVPKLASGHISFDEVGPELPVDKARASSG